MPKVWFRCRCCGHRARRHGNSRWCNAPALRDPSGRLQPCLGPLVRCEPPAQPPPGSAEWCAARALQHLIVRE